VSGPQTPSTANERTPHGTGALARDARLHRSTAARRGKHDRSLAHQLRRAAQSVTLNLAESAGHHGGNRRLRNESALGSAYETWACLRIARSWGYIATNSAGDALAIVDRVAAMRSARRPCASALRPHPRSVPSARMCKAAVARRATLPGGFASKAAPDGLVTHLQGRAPALCTSTEPAMAAGDGRARELLLPPRAKGR